MAPSRVRGFATVCPKAVAAGIIDSSSGSAIVTPTPWRNVRRDRCVLVMKLMVSSVVVFSCARSSAGSGTRDPAYAAGSLLLHPLLKRVAIADAHDQRRA